MENMRLFCVSFMLITMFSTAVRVSSAATLEVGNDKPFHRIEDAVTQAKPGDEIVVHPKSDGSPYRQPAVLVRTPKLSIRTPDPKRKIVLDGDGFVYSGKGAVPRAIVQFDPEACGCTLDGFKLVNARNESYNGAGVRINQANDVTIRNCEIRDNDMGIMSNGELAKQSGSRQLIERCTISDNGTIKDPGYNHNLYLGGTSVTVRNCEIARAVTGNNLKSRAHRNFIVGNHIHDSANRELDLVDAEGNTDVPGSDSLLIGNSIAKDPKCTGNKAVVHFGRDGKATHDGTIWLIGNTIRTPFISPVVDVSSGFGAVFIDNVIDDGGIGQKGVLTKLHETTMTAIGRFISNSAGCTSPFLILKTFSVSLASICCAATLFSASGRRRSTPTAAGSRGRWNTGAKSGSKTFRNCSAWSIYRAFATSQRKFHPIAVRRSRELCICRRRMSQRKRDIGPSSP